MIRNFVDAIELNEFDSSSMTSSYQSIVGTGLEYPCIYIRIINASNKDITISYDGSTDHDYVVAGTSLALPFQSNSQPGAYVAQMKQGTIIYAKGTAGTGNIYVSGYFL